MLKQIKKTIGILLAVCFLMSVTAAAVSAGPIVVKDKKTAIIIMKDVKTKFFKHHHKLHSHHHKLHSHHHKSTNMNGRKGKKMAVKTETGNKMPMKTETGNKMPVKTETGNKIPVKTETNKNIPIKSGTSKDMAVKS
jgi:hypothetical protein